MSDSEILIYQAPDGNVKIDVRLENETVWLTQPLMAELFQTTQQNISLHLRNIYEEGEMQYDATHKEFLSVRLEGKREVSRTLDYYNLDAIIQLNGRELLAHAGKISHQMALDKSAMEFDKYIEARKRDEHEESLKELEQDIKKLAPQRDKAER